MAAAMTVDDISSNVVNWKKGKTGHAFLLDEKGFVVAHPNPQYVQKRKNLNSDPLISEYRKKGWTSVTTQFNNSNGKPALGHVQGNTYGWSLALQQESSEVFDALQSTLNYAMALLGCTIAVVIIFSWLMARAITTPIRKLTDAAERMSLGELNVRIDIKSKDEIGLLAQAVGRMQTSLRLAMNRLRRRR
jgi:methyl-accepting chemotaxis protein